jgi:hypothetical protein
MGTYKGKLENGQVVWEGLIPPDPNGTPVEVTTRPATPPVAPLNGKSADPVWSIGDDAVKTGITDLASEHDHYAYGTPKQGNQ